MALQYQTINNEFIKNKLKLFPSSLITNQGRPQLRIERGVNHTTLDDRVRRLVAWVEKSRTSRHSTPSMLHSLHDTLPSCYIPSKLHYHHDTFPPSYTPFILHSLHDTLHPWYTPSMIHSLHATLHFLLRSLCSPKLFLVATIKKLLSKYKCFHYY